METKHAEMTEFFDYSKNFSKPKFNFSRSEKVLKNLRKTPLPKKKH